LTKSQLASASGFRAFSGLFLLAGILAASGAGTARASGFAAARFGGEHGHVTTTNPTALYFNPAGIALSSGTALYADGTLAMRRATWTREAGSGDPSEPPGTEGANVGQANLSNVFGGPMLGASTRLGDFAFGLALSVPFGGRAHWGRNPRFDGSAQFPLAADGVQRWHGIEGALTFIYGTLGVAYRFGRVAVGVTGNLIRSSMFSTQAKTPIGDGSPDTTREGRATLDVRGTHASFAGGEVLVSFNASKNKPGALELARFLARPENALALAQAAKSVQPATVGADTSAYYREHPDEQMMVRQFETAFATPNHPEWVDMEAAIEDEVEQALLDRKTAAQAVADAQRRLAEQVGKK